MSIYVEFSVLDSAERTTSGTGPLVKSLPNHEDHHNNVRMGLNVTASGGTTPTLDVTIEGRLGDAWYELASFTQASGVGKETINVSNAPDNLRAKWTIGGGGGETFTFNIDAKR